ncbi:MAG: hypothetical protein LBS05_02535 [Tannerellaceae bacterium]|jgi:hypothetical protein|nr:hypothetical protein [Tannerellaceae bacterium]
MKKNLSIWLFAAVIISGNVCYGQGNAYAALYAQECIEAEAFYTEHRGLFEAAAWQTGCTPRFLFAIVAPELTQFHHLHNRLETYMLKVLYVQNGASYADFSIGYFQIKPSFVEQLEAYASADTFLKARYASCLFARPQERASRVERIDRLCSVEWQVTYLALFCEVVGRKFAIAFPTDEEKIRFYASAFNVGFRKPAHQIKAVHKASFPHFSTLKFNYADISVWFYNNPQIKLN